MKLLQQQNRSDNFLSSFRDFAPQHQLKIVIGQFETNRFDSVVDLSHLQLTIREKKCSNSRMR